MDHDLCAEQERPFRGLVIGVLICVPVWIAAGYQVYSWIAG